MENVIKFMRKRDLQYNLKKADVNNAETQYMYAQMYFNGDGVEADNEKAIKWLSIAAKNGHGQAQCHLGACYYNGDKLERDYHKAVKLFEMSKESENSLAYICLGLAYLEGNGVENRDRKKAYNCFKRAHELGEPIGTYRLGNCYYIGIGVERNLLEALSYYEKAIKNGYKNDIKVLLLCLQEATDRFKSFKEQVKDGDGADFREIFELKRKIEYFSNILR